MLDRAQPLAICPQIRAINTATESHRLNRHRLSYLALSSVKKHHFELEEFRVLWQNSK
jgi:hypothetical protein